MKVFEFGPFQLNPETVRLFKDGVEIELEPQVFDALLLLLKNRDRVVSKQEMFEQLWQGRTLTDHVITRIIYELRKVLDEPDAQQSYIRTIRRKGYQFEAALKETNEVDGHESNDAPNKRQANNWLKISLLVLIGLLSINVFYSTDLMDDDQSEYADTSTYKILSILPIDVPSGNEELSILVQSLLDYLSHQLSSNFNIKVIHPYSFKEQVNQLEDIYSVRDATKSNFIIEGFIESVFDNSIKLHLILHKSNADETITAFPLGAFEIPYPQNAKDLKELYKQRKVSIRSIVEIIKPGIQLSSDRDFETQDPEAYRLVIAAHHIARTDECEDMRRAEELLLKAVKRDDSFVYAYLQLFNNYYKRVWICGDSTEYHMKGLAMAEKIDQLVPNKYQAVAMRRNTMLVESNQVEEAYTYAQNADLINPVEIYDLSYSLRYAGFLQLSAEYINQILQLDPFFFSEKPILHAPNTLLYLNQFEAHRDLLADPGNSYHDYFRGLNLHLSGDSTAAREILRGVTSLTPDDLFGKFSQALQHIIDQENDAAIAVVDAIAKQRQENGHTDGEMTYKLSQLYALAGESDKALQYFAVAVNQGFFPVNYFLRDPAMHSIADAPSFLSVVKQAASRHQAFSERFGLPSEYKQLNGE